MNPKLKIAFTASLLFTFSLFLVGLPVVISLCPMMMERGVPCCSTAETGVPALTSQTGDCCASYILAERSTTPFVSTSKFIPSNLVEVADVPEVLHPSLSLHTGNSLGGNHSPPGVPASNPLFILHAALLI